jgi:hypothetical protein
MVFFENQEPRLFISLSDIQHCKNFVKFSLGKKDCSPTALMKIFGQYFEMF